MSSIGTEPIISAKTSCFWRSGKGKHGARENKRGRLARNEGGLAGPFDPTRSLYFPFRCYSMATAMATIDGRTLSSAASFGTLQSRTRRKTSARLTAATSSGVRSGDVSGLAANGRRQVFVVDRTVTPEA